MNIVTQTWLKEVNKIHDIALDYLIAYWKEEDKYDKAIAKVKYYEWKEKLFKTILQYHEFKN